MKQIDNRQKQQIVTKAKTGTFGGKNPKKAHSHEKVHVPDADTKGNEVSGEEGGIETYHRAQPKVGRNDPCPCGSGQKYKKCCLE